MGKVVLQCECGATSKTRSKVVKGVDYRPFICNGCLREGRGRGGKSHAERHTSHYTHKRSA